MKKHTGKSILSVLLAALLMAASISLAAFSAVAADHVHQYTAETVVEAGYMYSGYTVWRCSCGDSYTTWTPALTQPYCEAAGGRVNPGASITIEAHLYCCSHLDDLSIDLIYNDYWLTLTDAVCAAYGTPERITDKALYFDSLDPDVQDAVLRLTFAVQDNAPTGIQTVTIAGCGVSACAVDNGEQIVLTAQRAALQIYRPPKLIVTAPDEPVYAGETVQMTVDLQNNPGIAGMAFEIHYDTQTLTLTEVREEGMFAQGSIMMSGNLSVMPYRILWDDATATQNHTENGTILTLTFAVNETAAAGATSVWLTFEPDDILDLQLQQAEMTAYDAELTIVRRIPGDTDGDGDTDLMDIAYLSRYLAHGWDVEINARNSDVNRDGAIDLKDVVLIRRFLAGGWGVTLQ